MIPSYHHNIYYGFESKYGEGFFLFSSESTPKHGHFRQFGTTEE
jgi:hypothetical protein